MPLHGKNSKNQRTEEPNRISPCIVVLWFFCSLNFYLPARLNSQDIVIVSSASDSAARIKKAGQILDYTGLELKLRTTLGIEETIPAGRVVEIQTRWSPVHEAGRTARSEGRLDDAI